jgi:hypothetical protein
MIPTGNVPALVAYYLGFLAVVPAAGTWLKLPTSTLAVVGIVLGIVAILVGIQGVTRSRRVPAARGGAHAWTGIVLGLAVTVAWIVLAF